MGLTSKSISILKPLIDQYHPTSVCDIGAQNLYCDRLGSDDPFINSKVWLDGLDIKNLFNPFLKGNHRYPFASEIWKKIGVNYLSVDLSGQNDSVQWDIAEPLRTIQEFDFVMDYGTSEHTKDHYQCWRNIHDLTKIGGLMIHENPKTGNWPGHGYHYIDSDFIVALASLCNYKILLLEEWPAMGNDINGWNVITILRKLEDKFVERGQYPKTYSK